MGFEFRAKSEIRNSNCCVVASQDVVEDLGSGLGPLAIELDAVGLPAMDVGQVRQSDTLASAGVQPTKSCAPLSPPDIGGRLQVADDAFDEGRRCGEEASLLLVLQSAHDASSRCFRMFRAEH